MPRNQLRTSGMIQSAIIALVLGVMLGRDPSAAPSTLWPNVLAGYGFLAATVPWLVGGVGREEFSPGFSLLLGVVFALPLSISAYWLSATPYQIIGLGCWVLVALWGLHFVASVVIHFMKPRS